MPIKYQLKTDPEEMVGRECPRKSCKAYFKIGDKDVYLDIDITCPKCGEKANVKKYTTEEQIQYINSLIFHKDECPLGPSKYTNKSPCIDYVERPAKCTFICDLCNKKFGYDDKPGFCPYCGATKEHLHEQGTCEIKPGITEP